MKKTLRIFASALVTASIIFIAGCKKGQDGAPGQNGKDGSANVTAHTFSVNTWSSNASRWYVDLTIPELTSSNINSASVQVYFSTVSNDWVALPYTYVTTPNNYFMGFISEANLVEVTWECNSTITIGSDPNTIFATSVQIKVVVIPPVMRKANPKLNWKNYQEVKAAFNLKD